jgi:hypothetical protein
VAKAFSDGEKPFFLRLTIFRAQNTPPLFTGGASRYKAAIFTDLRIDPYFLSTKLTFLMRMIHRFNHFALPYKEINKET